MKRCGLALILFWVLNLIADTAVLVEKPRPRIKVEQSLETMKEWVAGTRLWVVWTTKNSGEAGKDVSFTGPEKESKGFYRDTYSYALYDLKSGKCVAERKYIYPLPSVALQDHLRSPSPSYYMLKPQESVRILFPLDWPLTDNPPPGEYELRFFTEILDGTAKRYWGPSQKITIRNPTAEEKRILEKLSPLKWEGASDPTMGGQPEFQLPDSLKKNTGLGFELMLNHLAAKHAKVEEMTVDELSQNLPELFAPEMMLFKYEILTARKEDAKARIILKDLLPGLYKIVLDIHNGSGPLEKVLQDYESRKGRLRTVPRTTTTTPVK